MGTQLAQTFTLGSRIQVQFANGTTATGAFVSAANNYMVWNDDAIPGISTLDLTGVQVTAI